MDSWRRHARALGSLVLFVSSLPLVIVACVGLVRFGLNWRTIVFAFLATVTTALLSVSNGGRDLNRTVNDAFRFLEAFRHCTFRVVSVDAYLEAVGRFHGGDLRDPRVRERFVPYLTRFDGKRLRIVEASIADGRDGPRLAQAVTFANLNGAWIVLPVPMARLTELQFFVLLHEIGHTTFSAFTSRWIDSSNKAVVLRAIPFLAATLAPSVAQTAALAGLTAAWYAAATWDARERRETARLIDEIRADVFALERCTPRWCQRYSPEQLSNVLCRDGHATVPSGRRYAALPSRAEAFVANLNRLRRGAAVETPAPLRTIGLPMMLESLLAIALSVMCGLSLAHISGWRIALAAALMLVAGVLGASFLFIQSLQADLIDDGFNVKPITSNALKFLQRAVRQREQLKAYGIVSRDETS